MMDNIACYHDKVADLEVYENFTAIVEKARKTVKSEEILNDLEMKLRFCHNKAGGDGEAPTDEIMSQMKDLIIKPPPPPKQTRSRKKKKSSESGEDVEAEPKSPRAARTKRPPRAAMKRRQPACSEESDDDDLELPTVVNSEESDEEDFEVSVRSVRGAKKKPGQKTKPTPSSKTTSSSRRQNR